MLVPTKKIWRKPKYEKNFQVYPIEWHRKIPLKRKGIAKEAKNLFLFQIKICILFLSIFHSIWQFIKINLFPPYGFYQTFLSYNSLWPTLPIFFFLTLVSSRLPSLLPFFLPPSLPSLLPSSFLPHSFPPHSLPFFFPAFTKGQTLCYFT